LGRVGLVGSSSLPVALSSRLPGERGLPPRLTALRWLSAVAIGLPVAIMAGIGIVSWDATWREAESELTRSSDAVAEYVLRVLDAHRVAADRVNDLLENFTNEQIQQHELQLYWRLARLFPDLPLVQTIAISTPDGLMLLTANVYPVPPNTIIADREWIRDLKKPDAPSTHVSKVSVGRLDANLFFGVSRRRLIAERGDSSETYDGVINVSIEPNRVAAGFAELISEPTDVVRVIRTDGEILSRRPSFAAPLPALRPQTNPSFFQHIRGAGGRATYSARVDGIDRLVVLRRIPRFPVFASVAREHSAIHARWWRNFAQHLGLGVPAIGLVAAMAIFAARRAEERDRAQAAARFQAVFDASPVGMAVVNQSGEVVASNDILTKLIGINPHEIGSGFRLADLMPPEFVKVYREAIAAANKQGAAGPTDVDLIVREGRTPVRIAMSSLPGDPPRIVMAIQDIRDVREAEARRELMMREVEHRAKNTLAVVQAALRLGASGATDAQALARAVEARVAALARSQSLLTSVGEEGAPLRDLIEQEVAPFAPRRAKSNGQKLVIEGPPVRVVARAAQALTMVFHELATNAAKYGAFSSADGSVHITWRIDEDHNVLVFDWTEVGGSSRGEAPTRVGFGSRLIDTNIEHQLGGTLERRWTAAGLCFEARIPLAHVQAEARR
jgi:PAS domain S-box-containing protein